MAGVAPALKERNPGVKIALSDPMGAALYNWFTSGELKAEGDSITEGIGQVRVTKNLEGTPIDMAYQITDEEALPVLFDLIEHEGLVLGGSSAINVGNAACTRSRPRQDRRHHPRGRRSALPIQALQSGFPAQEKPAGTALDEVSQ